MTHPTPCTHPFPPNPTITIREADAILALAREKGAKYTTSWRWHPRMSCSEVVDFLARNGAKG